MSDSKKTYAEEVKDKVLEKIKAEIRATVDEVLEEEGVYEVRFRPPKRLMKMFKTAARDLGFTDVKQVNLDTLVIDVLPEEPCPREVPHRVGSPCDCKPI